MIKFIFIIVLIALSACSSSSDGNNDDGDECVTDDDCSTGEVCTSGSCVTDGGGGGPSTGCSDDESDELAVGTYVNYLCNIEKVQVKIFRSDCTYCIESIDTDDDCDPDEFDLDEDGTWSSEYSVEPELVITAGTNYDLSGDGLTLSQGDSSWGKDNSGTFSCGGETVQ